MRRQRAAWTRSRTRERLDPVSRYQIEPLGGLAGFLRAYRGILGEHPPQDEGDCDGERVAQDDVAHDMASSISLSRKVKSLS